MVSDEILNDGDFIEIDDISGNSCQQQKDVSPGIKRRLWTKTPFSPFSSDSTIGSAAEKCTENLRSLRKELQNSKPCDVKKADPERSRNINRYKGGIFRCFVNNEVSIRRNNRSKPLQGPLRVLRLCVMSIIFPGILVGVPLYMRYFVYGEQVYPIGMTDMRLLDHRISTLWCQSQTVWSNATFNAYLMDSTPQVEKEHEYVSMTRDLKNLEDDMKEYWGFYLLKGSVISVSTCARYPGASLILIRGHKHLKDCAYIGDDSSEEIDELYPDDVNSNETHQDPPNRPERMTKMTDGVIVHGKSNSSTGHLDPHHRKLVHSMSDSISRDKPRKILGSNIKVGNKIHLAFAEFGNKLAKHFIEREKLKANQSDSKVTNKKSDHLNLPTTESSTIQSSKEIYEDVMRRLEKLGDKGKRVLEKLNSNQKFINENYFNSTKDATDTPEAKVKSLSEMRHKIRHNKKLNHKNLNETGINNGKGRKRRELLYRSIQDEHDEEANAALEEDMNPDGFAQIRNTINETTSFDKSNSEFWSSFSSSEERLLNCDGLLVNLPLKSNEKCNDRVDSNHHGDFLNSITYRVTSNGYYFFVFNSENEVKPNFLRIHFLLEKTKYDVSKPVASCKNQTSLCSLPLSFWSEQKVVLQVPLRPNDALWNQEFLAVSTCEPRTVIYMICVIAAPLFILLFAFQ